MLGVFVIAFAFLLYKGQTAGEKPAAQAVQAPAEGYSEPLETIAPQEPPVEEKTPEPKLAPSGPRMAIVIDDMGQDLEKITELIGLSAPITIAVMPGQRFSRETAQRSFENGLEVILHLPMEPKDKAFRPGSGALLTRMGRDELRATALRGLESVPHITGVNNHMGSKFTEDAEGMATVLELIKEKKLYFLDSRTSPQSVAGKVAGEMGLRSISRDVFLDNEQDTQYVRERLDELVRTAKRNGKAVGIGHPHPETFAALKEIVSKAKAEGVVLVKLSDLLE